MTDVRPFVTSYLEAIGARSRALPTGALAVTWPPTHVGKFGPATAIAFDPAVAEVARAELCVLGSDLLDRILADASSRGLHCIARVEAEAGPPPEDVLAANLTFRNAEPRVAAAETGLVPYVLFNFRVTLETDERDELLRSVLLNAETLQEHTAADAFLEEALTLPEEPIVAPADLVAAYRAACEALERSIEPDVRAVREKAKVLLADELRRIQEFYDTSIQELYASRVQAPLEAERVFRAERDRRIDEVRRKYALRAEARLVNARTILIPTVTMRVRIQGARAGKEVDLEYDVVNLETTRVPCDACGAALHAAFLCARGHLACDDCDRGCALCDYVACRLCEPEALAACATCRKSVCPDHAFVGEIGQRTYCGDHVLACPICGRIVGPEYAKPCGLCGQSYCAVDVDASGRCATCGHLAAVPSDHADVVRVTAAKGEPKNLGKWVRSENGKYAILVGKGAVFQYVYVLDKQGTVVRRRKGVGLVD